MIALLGYTSFWLAIAADTEMSPSEGKHRRKVCDEKVNFRSSQ